MIGQGFRSCLRAAMLLALAFGIVGAGSAGARTIEPYALTRSLEALQSQAAVGTARTNKAQRDLLIHIGAQFLASDPAVWSEPRNARAAIVYVLAGGQPAILVRLAGQSPPPAIDPTLLDGALAYASARHAAARAALDPIDALTLPPSLGGHLALAQANLAMEDDPTRALSLFATAGLMLPRTLVEEAALRRQIKILSQLGDIDRFTALLASYFRRFGSSLYARNLIEQMPQLWAGLDLAGDTDTMARAEAASRTMVPSVRRDLYLAVARAALVNGLAQLAATAAEKARALSPVSGPAATRSTLYAAATAVFGDHHDRALIALEAVDPKGLAPEDNALRAAAVMIGAQVRETAPRGDPDKYGNDPPGRGAEPSPAAVRARKAIAATDAALRGATND